MNQSKQIFLLLIILSFILTSCNENKRNVERTNEIAIENRVDSIVQPFITDSLIAGTVIGIIQNGQVKFLKSYGFSEIEKKTPLENNAIFPIASVTKTFTSIAIMQLVEKGLISLDDNINKFIDFDTNDKIVTVEQLLNHTSGIKDYTESDIPSKLQEGEYTTADFIRLLEEKPFDFNPGEAMDYNNSGYYLLAMIVEKVSDVTYEEYLNHNIFELQDMTSTGNCYSSTINSKIVTGFNMDNEGKLNRAKLGDLQMAMGAGSICSTVGDLLKWQIALHHSKKLLNKKSYQLITSKNKLKNGGYTNYGLGLEVTQYNGNKVLSHNGIIEGYLSDTRYFPESDLTIVTLINTLGKIKPTNISNTIADSFIEKKDITKVFEGKLDDLSGNYSGIVMGNKIIMNVLEENEQLIIDSRGNKIPIQYIGQNAWLAEDGYVYEFMENKMQVNAPKLSIIFNKEE